VCVVFFLNSWFAATLGSIIEILLVALVVTASLACFMSLIWDYDFVFYEPVFILLRVIILSRACIYIYMTSFLRQVHVLYLQ